MVRIGIFGGSLALVAGAILAPHVNATPIALLSDCTDPKAVIATIAATDRVQVRYALGGAPQTCYAVSAAISGKTIAGYLIGDAHPDVAAFVRATQSAPIPIPAAAATPENENPVVEAPKTFAGLSGISEKGTRVSLDGIRAPILVLYFWSANDKRSIEEAGQMESVNLAYRRQGVALVGVVSGSVAKARRVIRDEEVIWPQIVDADGAIAARYPETRSIRYYVLDRNRNVVAALKSPEEVQRELTKLRRQPGGAE